MNPINNRSLVRDETNREGIALHSKPNPSIDLKRPENARMLSETGGASPHVTMDECHKLSSSERSTAPLASKQNDFHEGPSPTIMSITRSCHRGKPLFKKFRRAKTYRDARPPPIQTTQIETEESAANYAIIIPQHPESPRHATQQTSGFFPSPRSVLDRRSSSDSFF